MYVFLHIYIFILHTNLVNIIQLKYTCLYFDAFSQHGNIRLSIQKVSYKNF